VTKYLNAKHGIEILYDDGVTQILTGKYIPSSIGIAAEIGSLFLYGGPGAGLYNKIGDLDTDWNPVIASTVSGTACIYNSFISLLDTPPSYEGAAGKYPRVTADGTGLEFDYIEWISEDEEAPLIPATAISGTHFENFDAGRLLIGATGNKPDLVYNGPISGLAFDATKIESCYGSFKIPYSWNTDSDIYVTINFMNDVVQVGNNTCSWRMDFQSYHHGENYYLKNTTVVNINYTLSLNAVSGTFYTHTLIIPSSSGTNVLSRGDIVAFRFYRDGTSSSDTMVGDAILITLMVEMQTGQHVEGGA